jgi:hypothetical protein
VADGKSRRFVIFWPPFCEKVSKSDFMGFIEKPSPQKALCLGVPPRDWNL